MILFLETRGNHKGLSETNKEGGGHSYVLVPKVAALKKHCALVHFYGERISSVHVPDVFGGLPVLHILKPPSSNAVKSSACRSKFVMNSGPTVKKESLALDI